MHCEPTKHRIHYVTATHIISILLLRPTLALVSRTSIRQVMELSRNIDFLNACSTSGCFGAKVVETDKQRLHDTRPQSMKPKTSAGAAEHVFVFNSDVQVSSQYGWTVRLPLYTVEMNIAHPVTKIASIILVSIGRLVKKS